jgi:5-methylcytosine-specific restriction endonuclease McrA
MSMPDKRTYAERADYLKKAVSKRRKELKQKAVMQLGGKCQICSYDKTTDALHFHHRNSKAKSFGLSQRGLTRSWKKVQDELKKCVLICANCHAEIHAGITQLPMETSE